MTQATAPTPPFRGAIAPLSAQLRARMTGLSFRPDCPVTLDDLCHLQISHWGFDGAVHEGEIVVAASVADDVLTVFRRLYEVRFPLRKVRLVDEYGADDDASMADDNTSGFNGRRLANGAWSQHAYGTAIDLNPVENPYVLEGAVLPPNGAPYVDRAQDAPGMIHPDGPVVAAFRAIGWKWGGDWTTRKDYQHFSLNGR